MCFHFSQHCFHETFNMRGRLFWEILNMWKTTCCDICPALNASGKVCIQSFVSMHCGSIKSPL